MNWFKHDTDATQDAKIRKLLIRYGAVGYAIYFHCLELIAAETSETNLTFQLEHDSEIIADNLHIRGTAEKSGIDIVQEIMRYIIELNLFQESGGQIFCFKLLKRLDSSMTSNQKFRDLITQAKGHHDGIMMPSCKPSSLQDKPNEQAREKSAPDGEPTPQEEKAPRGESPSSSTPSSPKRFTPPTVDQVRLYCDERGNRVDPERFVDFYASKGWKVGNATMKDWQAAVRNWERTDKAKPAASSLPKPYVPPPEIAAMVNAHYAQYEAEEARGA